MLCLNPKTGFIKAILALIETVISYTNKKYFPTSGDPNLFSSFCYVFISFYLSDHRRHHHLVVVLIGHYFFALSRRLKRDLRANYCTLH